MARYFVVAVLLAVLVADLGYRAWSQRPYVVTEWSIDYSRSQAAGLIRYRLPGGGIGTVILPAIFQYSPSGNCWEKARIGQALPDCAFSWESLTGR